MKAWTEPPPVSLPPRLAEAIGGHPLVGHLLARRGLDDVARVRVFLDPALYDPADALQLPGVSQAVEHLRQAIEDQKRILVWGDFDVDGQTSTALLVETLGQLGAQVRYHIPVRARESHGIGLPVLAGYVDQGIDLLLTCDTGIAAHEAVAYARDHGVTVIVTDHHQLPPVLPDAQVLVNPHLLPLGHPLETLPGVGVAYKLAEALCRGWGLEETCRRHLDLVALGVVADLALLVGDTRYLLQQGLEELRRTPRLGLQAMLDLAELNPDRLTEEHIAYELAPRLNALGRLDDANPAVEFLTTTDPSRARILATQLEGLNTRRRLLTSQVFQGALAQIERDPGLVHQDALVLAHPAWPAGVIGIVASRLVERYDRPVVLIASPPGQLARGSARSIPGCDITAAIAAHGELLEGYGGHAMAAGLSMHSDQIPRFRRALARTVGTMLGEDRPEPSLQIDGDLPLADLSLELVEDLERLAPFGPGNLAPILVARDLSLQRHSTVGRNGEHRQLVVEDQAGRAQSVIWWQGAEWPLPQGTFDLAYRVRTSTYRGQSGLQVEWIDARPAGQPDIPVELAKPMIHLVDHRQDPEPQAILAQLRARGPLQVWCEATARQEIGGSDRGLLVPAPSLAIWTTPPGRRELQAVLARVQPQTVYLFGIDPTTDSVQPFLKRLAGVIKHELGRKKGPASVLRVSTLAAATAQREETVRLGLAWLASRGHVTLVDEQEDEIRLELGGEQEPAELAAVTPLLEAALAESAAYRAFFARAEPDLLVGH